MSRTGIPPAVGLTGKRLAALDFEALADVEGVGDGNPEAVNDRLTDTECVGDGALEAVCDRLADAEGVVDGDTDAVIEKHDDPDEGPSSH